MSDTGPVARQLDAYNRHDVDAFLACYTPDAWFGLIDGTPTCQGHAALRERYARQFADNPAIRAELLSRTAEGGFVVDHERITGRAGGADLHSLVAYRLAGDRIDRVWFLRNPA